MEFLNLTPHEITIIADGKSFDLPVDGPAPRLAVEREPLGTIPMDYEGFSGLLNRETDCMADVQVCKTTMGDPVGLPEPQDGVLLIVSALVAEHPSLAWRKDLAFPGEAIRDPEGKIVGAKGLCAGLGLAKSLRKRQSVSPVLVNGECSKSEQHSVEKLVMNWVFDYSGEWTALSEAKEGLQYRIQVCDDGTFDISKSDHGLVTRTETFQMLRNAKEFCETAESALRQQL